MGERPTVFTGANANANSLSIRVDGHSAMQLRDDNNFAYAYKREGDWKKSHTAHKLYRLLRAKENQCPCCNGYGHPHWLCGTKKQLDKEARLLNDINNWADFKYHWWWGKMSEAEQETARKEALSFAKRGPPRKKYWKRR